MDNKAWTGFIGGDWQETINVRDFIQKNYTVYTSDDTFLTGATERTKNLKKKFDELYSLEQEKGGVIDIDTDTVSSLLSYAPGYLDKDNEIIVGLQTDRPLVRGVNPFAGIAMARQACEAYGYKVGKSVEENVKYLTTHNDGVFKAYSDEMKKMRKSGVITGLPDSYGRGRVIGDYRRVALYGVDRLIEEKILDKKALAHMEMLEENIRLAEELHEQISYLNKLKEMALAYGIDISKPATNAKEAVQWLYFAYLGSIKQQNGAALSIGRISSFLDIYFERDIKEGILTEETVQEIVDDLILKLRMARQLRTPDYNDLFAGDPMWITEAVGGISENGTPLVTKTSFRFLHTLYTLGPAPEPNITILWSEMLPEGFKRYCSKVSIETDSIQYENDDLMRPIYGDDYGIACCVSAMRMGKEMQFFGARCNLPKVLLMALNGGIDELTGQQVGPTMDPIKGEYLDYNEVVTRFDYYRDWLCKSYVNTMNVIHYMHDKYAYEKLHMALHDTNVHRFMAFGIAGLSVVGDSLSAIKYSKVKPIKNDAGIIVDFEIEGEYPEFGNDDDRVDDIVVKVVEDFDKSLKKNKTYRNAEHTLSILTITSNVVYGKKTGSTPDGRKVGEPFAPGANPMHNRDKMGALASLNSVAKIPFESCRDGVSCTFTVTPKAIGSTLDEQIDNLVSIMDGYFGQNAHHLNVNVLDKSKLIKAMEEPQNYPNLTIRVSGYAVNFHRLTKKQQLEVIDRTFHERL